MSTIRVFRPLRSLVVAIMAIMVLLGSASLSSAHAQVGPFAVGSSFNSTFNGSHTGWSPVVGPWKQTPSYYTTVGEDAMSSSIVHSGAYKNFVFSSRLKVNSTSANASAGLVVRGDPSFPNADGQWRTGYFFAYDRYNNIDIFKLVSGTPTVLYGVGGKLADPLGWNVLKVVAYDDALLFYANGERIYQVFDTDIVGGRVGIYTYRWHLTLGQKLLVDWAKLTVIP